MGVSQGGVLFSRHKSHPNQHTFTPQSRSRLHLSPLTFSVILSFPFSSPRRKCSVKAGTSPVQLEPRNTAGARSVDPTEAPGGVSIRVWNKPTCSVRGGRNPLVSLTAVSPAPSLYLAHGKALRYQHLSPAHTCHLQLDFGATHQLPGGPSCPALPPNLPSHCRTCFPCHLPTWGLASPSHSKALLHSEALPRLALFYLQPP